MSSGSGPMAWANNTLDWSLRERSRSSRIRLPLASRRQRQRPSPCAGRIEAQGSARLVLAAAPSQTAHARRAVRCRGHRLVPGRGVPHGRVRRPVTGLGATLRPVVAQALHRPGAAERDRSRRWRGPGGGGGSLCGAGEEAPIDIVLAGIGVNGHLAFNDPPADFTTTDVVQVVALDNTSRTAAGGRRIVRVARRRTHACLDADCPVPAVGARDLLHGVGSGEAGRRSADLTGAVDPDVPASALWTHPRARLFLDQEAVP